MLVRFVREPGLLRVMDEISSQQFGSEIYVHRIPELDGVAVRDILWKYERAILIGTVVGEGTDATVQLVRALDERVERGASLVVIADDGELALSSRVRPRAETVGETLTLTREPKRSLLLVGWNHQVAWMLRELEASRGETWRVLVASSVP